jgi:hypothetical protein
MPGDEHKGAQLLRFLFREQPVLPHARNMPADRLAVGENEPLHRLLQVGEESLRALLVGAGPRRVAGEAPEVAEGLVRPELHLLLIFVRHVDHRGDG